MHRGDKENPHNGVGAPHGPRTEPFDRWFRYPAGFNNRTMKECFSALEIPSGSLVVDPFAGVGTTGVKSSNYGFRFVGIEAHPEIAELADLKFKRPPCLQRLVESAELLTAEGRCVDPRLEHPIIVQSFDAEVLVRLLGLRDSIKDMGVDPWRLYLKWCLLGALRDCASASVGWPYQRPGTARKPRIVNPYRAFMRRVRWMAEDLASHGTPEARVRVGDARQDESWREALPGQTADAIITSPPYLNNFDYADATRLELYFWGVARSWGDMTQLVRSSMVVATTQQTKKALAASAANRLEELYPRTASKVRELTVALQRERAERPRGKEYDQLVPSYFADLAEVLVCIKTCTVPGARIAIVLGDSAPYGVYVDTPLLLSSLGKELGFESLSIKTLRRRGLRWHSNGVRHSVALAEKLVLLCSPMFP